MEGGDDGDAGFAAVLAKDFEFAAGEEAGDDGRGGLEAGLVEEGGGGGGGEALVRGGSTLMLQGGVSLWVGVRLGL